MKTSESIELTTKSGKSGVKVGSNNRAEYKSKDELSNIEIDGIEIRDNEVVKKKNH